MDGVGEGDGDDDDAQDVFTYMELAEGVAELVGGDVGRESSLLAWWEAESWSLWSLRSSWWSTGHCC